MATAEVRTTRDVYREFEAYLDFLNYKEDTKYRYLKIADEFLSEQRGQFTREAVMLFLSKYNNRSSNYRRWLVYPIKLLFTSQRQEWPFNKNELPKQTRRYQPFFTYEQYEKIMQVAEQSPLDYALLRLDAVTGMRRIELTWLNEDDYKRPEITIAIAKSTRGRTRTLDPGTCDALDLYLKSRRSKDGALFVGKTGYRLSRQQITDRMTRLRKAAGIELPKAGWHAIRRGLSTWLFKAGWREKELQEYIGWESPAMPANYIQLVDADIQEKVEKTHPFFK